MKNQVNSERIPVPCGKCPPCKKRRASGWSFRLVKQGDISMSALFITLTYDNKNCKVTPKNFATLYKPDISSFLKRLRRYQEYHNINNGAKIKYFLVGEYGGKTLRPHYHAIIFNTNYEAIEACWKMGNTHYGNVSAASIGYTLKYMTKKGKIPLHKNDDRQPEFAFISKGVGLNYLTEKAEKWHKQDLLNRMYVPLQDGKKASMPRYYKEKLYSQAEREAISAKMAQLTDAEILALTDMLGTNFLQNKKDNIQNQFNRMWKKSTQNDKL